MNQQGPAINTKCSLASWPGKSSSPPGSFLLLLSAHHPPTPDAPPMGVAAPQTVTRQLHVALQGHKPGGW
jgi:hypothetical protein